MSFRDGLIAQRDTDWFLAVGSESELLDAGVGVEDLVAGVQRLASRARLKSPRCVIAPSSGSCFFAALRGGPELNVRDRNALQYELESHVPLDAEAMVADFVSVPSAVSERNQRGTSDDAIAGVADEQTNLISAVAIEVRRWRDLVEALEASGVVVRSIVPAAVLATRALARDLPASGPAELLLVDPTGCDAVIVEHGLMIGWKRLTLEPSILRQHRRLDAGDVVCVLVVGADSTQLNQIHAAYEATEIRMADRSLESCWIEGAQLALAKPSKRWFELRRGALGPSDPLRPVLPQLRLVTLAAIACLVAIAIGGWWRGRRIEQAIQQVTAEQRSAFEKAFPNTPVPAALLRRVRSEHAKVMGSRGASAEIDVPQPATEILRELLVALPESVRFRIKSLKIADGQVDLDLQVRTAVDAGAVAAALESRGFEVRPPITTRKDEQSFDSVLEARWTGNAAANTQGQPSPTQSTSQGASPPGLSRVVQGASL